MRKIDIIGMMLMGAVIGSFLGIGYAAYLTDKANGITVSQSLHNNGL